MTPIPQDPAGRTLRPNFGFSINGLPPREELLFKSLVRLLNHRTQYGWFYTPEQSAEHLDLRVISENLLTRIRPPRESKFQAVLTLSAVDRKQPGYLSLPVRADELELELNRLGTLIETTRRNHCAGPAAATAQTNHAEQPSVTGDRQFKLTRWPSTDLLTSPERLRIATMLVGRPIALAELAFKTRQPLPQCIEFVNDLWRANFLTCENVVTPETPQCLPETATTQAKPTGAGRGLLSRIRSRLGL